MALNIANKLTEDDRKFLSIVAIGASSDVEACLAVIEKLTGERIVSVGEKDN